MLYLNLAQTLLALISPLHKLRRPHLTLAQTLLALKASWHPDTSCAGLIYPLHRPCWHYLPLTQAMQASSHPDIGLPHPTVAQLQALQT